MSNTICLDFDEPVWEDGIVTVWVIKEKELNECWRSVVPVWEILNARQLFVLCCDRDSIEIPRRSLSKNFERIT